MISYNIGRPVQAIPVMVLASIAVFLVLRLIPGDPADAIAAKRRRPSWWRQFASSSD